MQAVLEHAFEGFLNKDNFTFVTELKNGKEERYILDTRYSIKLFHDGKSGQEFEDNYQEIYQKYERRIKRLLDLIETSECPLFIRKNSTLEEAFSLRDTLITLRNHRPFVLLVLDSVQETEQYVDDNQLHYYYLPQLTRYSWKGDPAAWKAIFTKLCLTTSEPAHMVDFAD